MPTGQWCGDSLQGLRRVRCGPALGQQQHGAPPFPLPLPGLRRQNHPPVQTPDSHLTLLKLDFVHLNGVSLRLDKASVKRGEDFFTVGVRT